jgi:UDP-glucose:(heptosyl)LPS alpha-1,3-glucosyltransferase
MRIAIIQETVDAQRGGAETSTLEMARRLAELGQDVTVVCSGRGAASAGESTPGGATVRIHAIEPSTAGRYRRTREFVQRAEAYCTSQLFDVIHAVTPVACATVYQPRGGTYRETVRQSTAMAGGPLARALRRLGRRFNRRQRYLLSLEEVLLSRPVPPVVAAVSAYVQRQVGDGFRGFPASRVRVVFNGVDVRPLEYVESAAARSDWRRRLHVVDDAPLVLFVAHNFRLKGLAELIRAVARSAESSSREHTPWLLSVAGRDDATRYQGLAARLGVQNRVRFLGAVDDVRGLYAAADVLAHPTWYDPCSRVVLEALCCGLPVVTTWFNGAAEVIEPGRHGVVVDSPDQIDRLSAAVTTCLRSDMRSACAADAARMRERLSMARHARELLELYTSAVRGAGSGGR